MNTAAQIERVLSFGQMSSTYKLAVLRSLVDFIIEHPAREAQNGFHFIPVMELARRVLTYYWGPSQLNIAQGPGGKTPVIPRAVNDLATSDLIIPGVMGRLAEGGFAVGELILNAPELPRQLVATLVKVRQTLLEQPLRYIHNVGGETEQLFSLWTEEGISPGAPYEAHRKAALSGGRKLRGATNWLELLRREYCQVVLSARSYEEITELRFWLRDAIIIRWVRQCEKFSARGASVPVHAFELFPLERDNERVGQLKQLYRGLGEEHCLYSGELLGRTFDLDHLLPWSRFPVNLFWNMVPATPKVNRGRGGKFDRIPRWTDDLKARYGAFLLGCIRSSSDLFQADIHETYRRYFQQPEPLTDDPVKVAKELMNIVEHSHGRLLSAGVPLWG